MSTSINLSDPGIWDDRALISSWNEALEEYKKYHSIHVQKKDLADVLTDGELVQLKMERRALRKGPTIEPPKVNNADNDDDVEMDVSVDEEAIENAPFPNGTVPKDPVTQSNARTQSTETIAAAPATAPTMPQALLNGVQDGGLRNLMMSWYYAGYYTGLHEGQQKAKAELSSSNGQ